MRLSIQRNGATDIEVMFAHDIFFEAAKELGIIDCNVEVHLTFGVRGFDMPLDTDGRTCAHCREPYHVQVSRAEGIMRMAEILCHEMIHVKQMLLDQLTTFEGDDGKYWAIYKGQTVSTGDVNGPVEREAYEGQGPLLEKVLNKLTESWAAEEEKSHVPA